MDLINTLSDSLDIFKVDVEVDEGLGVLRLLMNVRLVFFTLILGLKSLITSLLK